LPPPLFHGLSLSGQRAFLVTLSPNDSGGPVEGPEANNCKASTTTIHVA
jgi:hypothetical protein